jgi:hypothetical protein
MPAWFSRCTPRTLNSKRVREDSACLRDWRRRALHGRSMGRPGRYPSDLTDEQWALIEPLLPQVKVAAGRRSIPAGGSWTQSCMWCGPAARGASSRRTFRRGRRCTGTSSAGNRPGSPRRSWPCCMRRFAGRRGAPPSPVPGSSTPRAARAPTPSEGLPRRRRGQENHRPEAAIVTDTLELLITVLVGAASRQDRDGATPVLLDAYLATPVRFVFADARAPDARGTGPGICWPPPCTSCASPPTSVASPSFRAAGPWSRRSPDHCAE